MKKIIFCILFTNVIFANATPGVRTVTSGEEVSGTVERGEIIHYKISASNGKTVKVLLNGLDNDADLRVRVGAKAKGGTYDCKSTNGGTNPDSCSLTLTSDDDVYIRINGFRATDYTLKATVENNNGEEVVTTLTSGQPISSSIERDKVKHYKVSASHGETVSIVLNGLDNDADLHVRVGAKAKGGTYDCKSTNGGVNTDTCSVTLDADDDVYIRVYGFRSTNFTLKATVQNGGAGNNHAINRTDSVSHGETKFYTLEATEGQRLESILDQLNADADLYVRVGARPTGSEYDCKSTNGGTNQDTCALTINHTDTVYIAVDGYNATSYRLRASLSNGGGEEEDVRTVRSGQTISASVARDSIKYYKIDANNGDKITATISDLNADADIYIKKGEKPTTSSYDCKSTNGGTHSDSCSINTVGNQVVYIGVSGFRATSYNLLVRANRKVLIPANPQIPTVLEDAEGGTLNPNWVTTRGDKPGYIWPTPHIPGAPSGTGVMVHHANGEGASLYRYELPVNNNSQMILSMDCGGLPNHKFDEDPESLRGYIPHYSFGVVVETRLGQRIMNWDSWYAHQGYGPRINDNGHNVFFNYPSPVELVSGYYKPITQWDHFEVNLNTELRRLEPSNEIIRIVQFFTTGGFLDNITLSAAN